MVEAVELGWWYAARLPGGEAMVTLMTDHDLARMHHLRGREQFVRAWAGSELLKTFLPPPAVAECEIVIRPAATQYLDRAAGPGWMAVGDALMAFDPLSSAGIGGALREAIDLSAALVRFLGGSSGADARQAAEAYASRASGSLRRFLVERRAMYARERRWPDSLFWRRRTTDVPGGATIGADHH
jgi:flavin-dependent dehydrogenase